MTEATEGMTMDAVTLLTTRQSLPKLVAPAPEGESLEIILQAGLRAPDHGGLTPWRFIVVAEAARQRLADILVAAVEQDNTSPELLDKAARGPFRAPMIIVVVAHVTPHAKVPAFEQYLSAGCATHAMQMAAVAQGFAGFWRTGRWAYDAHVKQALGVEGEDRIVGFLYLGSAACRGARLKARDSQTFVRYL